MNKTGVYDGFSSNYSGAGFSGMRFKFHGVSDADFDKWVETARAGGGALNRDDYLALEKPSEREPVRRYSNVPTDLYKAILNRTIVSDALCVTPVEPYKAPVANSPVAAVTAVVASDAVVEKGVQAK